MGDLQKKRKILKGHRGYAAKEVETIDRIIAGESEEKESLLRDLKDNLTETMKIIAKLNEEILVLLEKQKDIEQEIADANNFRKDVRKGIQKIDGFLQTTSGDFSEQNPNSSQAQNIQTRPSQSTCSVTVRARLPKLELKKFYGSVAEWQSFWDAFKNAVHENRQLSDIDKFTYLKGLLGGEAGTAIAGLSLTEGNYGAAIDILKKRFGDEQKIISAHMDKLVKLSPVYNGKDTGRLRRLYDEIEVQIRGLQGMGIQADSYGTLLVPMLLSKLPDDVKLEMSRGVEDGKWKLDDLLKKLIDEITARERCTSVSVSPTYPSGPKKSDRQSTSTFLAPGGLENRCAFCMGPHKHVDCRKIVSPSERKQIAKRYGRCFVCLQRGHKAVCCECKEKCKCGLWHHPALCDRQCKEPKVENENSRRAISSESQKSTVTGATLHINSRARVVLQTAQAIASTSGVTKIQGCKIRVIFDAGSQRSYVSEKLAEMLQLKSMGSTIMETGTFGQPQALVTERELVTLHVGHLYEEDGVQVEAFKVPVICKALQNQYIEEAKRVHPYLNKLWFSDVCPREENLEVDLLVGADYLWEFMKGDVVRGERDEPVAILTSLGWVLSGPLKIPQRQLTTGTNLVTHVLEIQDQAVLETVQESPTVEFERLWDFDSIGIRERDSVHENFLKSIKFKDGRYIVGLPWKEHHKELPLNYGNSLQRLNTQIRRLKRAPELLREYDQVIREQERDGVIEPVTNLEVGENGRTHYLPHHAVIRRDAKTTKVRVVYDASSRADERGPSLNDCLHVGPSLTQLLFDILVRFRCNRIALIADIEKAFLNIEVDSKDRDCLRFLWVDDLDKEEPMIVVYRFCRVVFGVSSSPFLLSATLRHHLKSYENEDAEFVRKVLKEFYVDDFNSGADSVEEAFTLYQKIKSRLEEASFRLRKWSSNSKDLMKKIQNDRVETRATEQCGENLKEDDDTYAKTTVGGVDELEDKEQKILGEIWNRVDDKIVFKFDALIKLCENMKLTKRNLLKIIAKFFDPLGMLSPLTVGMKVMFQEVCQSKLDWDEPLSEAFQERWRKWLSSLKEARSVNLTRCIYDGIGEKVVSYELHGFGDASERAYGAMVYLVCVTNSGRFVRLMASKTRVAPLSKQVIARLELMAARITAQLKEAVEKALQSKITVNSVHMWSDSITTLYWIKGEREWSQFVQNRVNEILRLTARETWNHCPGVENPADLASRGVTAVTIKSSKLWWQGPEWLSKAQEFWPSMNVGPTPESQVEIKASCRNNALLTAEKDASSIASIIPVNAYSSCEKLFRVTAYVRRFVRNAKLKKEGVKNLTTGNLTATEIEQAEKAWVKEAQSNLMNQKNFTQLQRDLGLYTDEDEVIRCHGRIPGKVLEAQAKHPALLPRDHHLTKLFIEQCHKRVHHGGVRETLAELRTRFWVSKGRQAVKLSIRRCVVCRRYEGTAYSVPVTAQLPSFRVEQAPPFSRVGIDFAGPLYVKASGNQMKKVYIALFSCAVTRAIYLDVVENLETPTFLRCFRKFIGRRGVPELVISDNAKTFKAASKELKLLYEHPEVQAFLTEKRITWRFNLEKAPWWGGFYERMVKGVKRCLRKTLGNARLSYDELSTVVIEVQGTLNVRPLTYVYEEGDSEEPLTPSHLMHGRRLTSLPPYPSRRDEEEEEVSVKGLNKRLKYLSCKLDHFWKRWKREYLSELREHHRRNLPKGSTVVQVGDMVTVAEEGVSRGKWRLGKVEELITGKDGETRGAKVKVLTKKGKPMYLSRPVQGLYPLEVRVPVYVRPIETNQVVEQVPVRQVPRRAAAINADLRRRQVDQLLADQGGSV